MNPNANYEHSSTDDLNFELQDLDAQIQDYQNRLASLQKSLRYANAQREAVLDELSLRGQGKRKH